MWPPLYTIPCLPSDFQPRPIYHRCLLWQLPRNKRRNNCLLQTRHFPPIRWHRSSAILERQETLPRCEKQRHGRDTCSFRYLQQSLILFASFGWVRPHSTGRANYGFSFHIQSYNVAEWTRKATQQSWLDDPPEMSHFTNSPCYRLVSWILPHYRRTDKRKHGCSRPSTPRSKRKNILQPSGCMRKLAIGSCSSLQWKVCHQC